MRSMRSSLLGVSLALLMSACAFASVDAVPAWAQAPWFQINSETAPTNLVPGGEGLLLVVVSNLGDAPIEGATKQVAITSKLPSGLVAKTITGPNVNETQAECTLATLTCTFKGVLYPYEQLAITIKVKVEEPAGTVTRLPVQASVQGGRALKSVSRTLQVPVGEQAGYGVEGFEVAAFNEDGTPATQAGEHPFQLTTTLTLNQTAGQYPAQPPKDFTFQLPPGLIGNPTALSQCSMGDFFSLVKTADLCPPSSVIGVATVFAREPIVSFIQKTVPVFNLEPAQGEPARFGFDVAGKIPIVIDTSVRTGGDYGVDAAVSDATETGGLLRSQLTLWGVPGDPRHNNARGWECVAGGNYQTDIKKPCPEASQEPDNPFLTLPTSCAPNPQSEPVSFKMQSDSWAEPGNFLGAEYAWMNQGGELLGFQDCGGLPPFAPEIDVSSEQHTAATPTGLQVKLKVKQESLLEPDGRAVADIRDSRVTLLEGVQLSPSAANGLLACPEGPQDGYEGIGFTGFQKLYGSGIEPGAQTATFTPTFRFSEEEHEGGQKVLPSCPDASKVGTVRIKTPLLSHELEGAVYLASPAPNGETGKNPFDSLIALYIVARDKESGVLVKLAGEGRVDEGTLQISTSFKNAPQVPFEELTLNLFGGQRASVTTPALCGSYATSATFTPWSDQPEASVFSPASDFSITSGVGGSGCPAAGLGFSPGFRASSENTQAGAFTDFQLELSRPDGDQALSTVTMHLPPGIAALLSSVELCPEAQAVMNACPPGSEIGSATAIAGLGSEPYVQEGGRVFITGPYGNAPFGLAIVTPAKAGPFDLGYVTVRSKLYIDPSNASVTVVSDPLPTQIRGIPLQLKRVLVSVDRPDFEFNPTSCDPMNIEGTLTGSEGAGASVSSPLQVAGCQNLSFSPQLSASAVGHGSKAQGTTFTVIVRSGGMTADGVAQAGIAKVGLQLPKQLSSRLPTLQKACADTTFDNNPASCDEGSVIGYATIHTPVLKNPLTGPAYLVSHGGAAFPDVEFVLQGENITLVLDGKTDIKGELTYSKFESTPDAPFTVFETVLPAGPHGVLTPNVAESRHFNLCGENLEMPTTITGQNGKVIEQATKITITGCGEVRSAKVKKLTPMQQLNRALASCRHLYKHSNSRRQRCERQAHTHYTRVALAACRHQHNHTHNKLLACERAARQRFTAPRTTLKKRS